MQGNSSDRGKIEVMTESETPDGMKTGDAEASAAGGAASQAGPHPRKRHL
jgi:hypothetical protein